MNTSSARFAFGQNWIDFLSVVDEQRIAHAENRLRERLGNLSGKTFLDIGCGSGIHSLAALRLGASRVLSFDYDQQSVECSRELKRRFASNSEWRIEQGSALDPEYLLSLGQFDIVYSWGALHHTGDMWKAVENVLPTAADKLLISLYADQGAASRSWRSLKKSYAKHPVTRKPIELLSLLTLWGPKLLIKPHRVISDWKNYSIKRGMSPWHDVVDWAGGYPFEFAKPEQVIDFVSRRGFKLESSNLPHGIIRVNEFLFSRIIPS